MRLVADRKLPERPSKVARPVHRSELSSNLEQLRPAFGSLYFRRSASDLTQIYAKVGEHDLAIDLIEKLLAIPGEMGPASLGIDPRWIPLREYPRFKALMK